MMITRQTIPGSWYSLELRRAVSLEISDPTRQGSKAIKIFCLHSLILYLVQRFCVSMNLSDFSPPGLGVESSSPLAGFKRYQKVLILALTLTICEL